MRGLMNKRGDLTELIIFIVINAMVLATLLLAISRAGNSASIYEEVYAKQIGLILDSAKAGTTVTLDVAEIFAIATDNNVAQTSMVNIDCNTNEVTVRLTRTGGYTFNFFNELNDCSSKLDSAKRALTISV